MKLKTLRETNNITQEKLAEDLGVEVKTIQRWEKGVPPLKDLLLLAKYFDVYPQELLDDNESMPHFYIGNSGAIDTALVKSNVLVSLRILSQGNIVNDIYRNISIEYTDEMKEDLLNISLKLTNLYSRMVFSLYTKKWINLLPTENVVRDKNNELYLKFCAIDLFHPEEGLLNNIEINSAFEEMCMICDKYKPNPLYSFYLPSYIGGLLIMLYKPTVTRPWIYFVCEQIFLELLGFVGKKVL